MKLLVKKNIVNKRSELNANDKPNYRRQKIMGYKDNVKNIRKLSIETNCAKKTCITSTKPRYYTSMNGMLEHRKVLNFQPALWPSYMIQT